jgi:hypothetical protein
VSGWLVRHQRLVNGSAGVAAVMAGSRTALLAVPEPLPWMAELGEVCYDLSLAWVTAWAFQLLVIVLPAERERKRFQDLVAPRIDRLIVLGMDLSDAIYAKAKAPVEGNFSVDAALVKSVCQTTALSDDMPNWLGDWGTVLRHLGGLADKFRASLRPFYAKLPADVLEALDQEELAMDELMRMERFSRVTEAPDMSRLESSVFRWLSSLHMLHSIRTSAFAPNVAAPKRSPLNQGSIKVPMDDFIRQHEDFKEFLKRDGR